MKTRPLLLVVDDEPAILHMLKQSLEDEHYQVATLSDGNKTLETIGALVPDLVLLDIFMPNCNGVEVLAKIKQEYPSQSVMMLSGFGTIQIATDALKKGAVDFIEKPFNFDDILAKISLARSLQHPKKRALQDSDYLELGLIGASSLYKELMSHVALVAPLNLPIVIYGPSGSGKTLMARYIHTKSSHAKTNFEIMDASLDSDLMGALFELPGTLLIKNIDQASLQGQQALLNYLSSDVQPARIIVTAQESLFGQMQAGNFNASLFALLQSTPIQIPPLNKRRYDIPLLVHHFIEQSNAVYKNSMLITPGAMRILRNHDWQGDVAELKMFIDAIVASAHDPYTIIDVKDIQKALTHYPAA